MAEAVPVVLIPGLNCSARLYAEQIPALWRFGPVQVADHTRDDSMDALATRILAVAPPRFALAGLSMGGYLALTIVRHAPERVQRLALLDTSARPETPEQTARRRPQRARRRAVLGCLPRGDRPLLLHSARALARAVSALGIGRGHGRAGRPAMAVDAGLRLPR